MAAEDYNVADRPNAGLTARERLAETEFVNPDEDSAAAAEAAGVSNPAYIGYAAALNTFQAREDIESLADRRKREYGSTFDDGAFMRAIADGTPPSPGTPDGKAPASA
jgi:hypothetical protein